MKSWDPFEKLTGLMVINLNGGQSTGAHICSNSVFFYAIAKTKHDRFYGLINKYLFDTILFLFVFFLFEIIQTIQKKRNS